MHYKEVKAILTPQNGLNIYRGCNHGCMFCDGRSTCHRMDHDFEDIEVKARAADMLENALKKKRTRSMINTGSLTDPYVDIEEELQLMRRCLNQIERFDFGLVVQTKSNMILRDIDILDKINRKTKCVVVIKLCAKEDSLARILEPGASTTSERVEILRAMRERGIPTLVSIGPILPYINDTEENLRGILKYCAKNGVYGIMTDKMWPVMREGNKERFLHLLYKNFPDLGSRYEDEFDGEKILATPNQGVLKKVLREVCDANGMVYDKDELLRFTREYKNKTIGTQMSIFDFAEVSYE